MMRQHATRNTRFLRRVKMAVQEVIPDAEVILYGSRARGEAGAHSDWDILVLTDRDVDLELEETVWDHLYRLELETAELISAIVKNRQEWATPLSAASPLHERITLDGIAV